MAQLRLEVESRTACTSTVQPFKLWPDVPIPAQAMAHRRWKFSSACCYRACTSASRPIPPMPLSKPTIHKAYDDKCNELTVVAGQLQVYKGVNELLTRQLEDLLQRQAALWKYLGEREEEITYLKNINSRQPEAPIPEDRKDQRIAELSRELKNLKAQVEAGHRRGNYSLGKRRFVDYEE
ncbi:hypothetical protein BDW69DRAFT_180436 [Aspergillus filifer]